VAMHGGTGATSLIPRSEPAVGPHRRRIACPARRESKARLDPPEQRS
jgi:hypothetical protein